LEAIERVRKEFEGLREEEQAAYAELFCETVVAAARYGAPFAVACLLSKPGAAAGVLLRHIGYLLGAPAARVVEDPKEDMMRRAPLILLKAYQSLIPPKKEQQ